jgi:hypothetical protein
MPNIQPAKVIRLSGSQAAAVLKVALAAGAAPTTPQSAAEALDSPHEPIIIILD